MDYACSSAQNIAMRQIEDILTHFRVGGFFATRTSDVSSSGAVSSRLFAVGSEAMEAIEYIARMICEREPSRQCATTEPVTEEAHTRESREVGPVSSAHSF